MAYAVGKAEFAKLVEEALAGLPPQFAPMLDEVSLEIVDRATNRQRSQLGLGPNQLLLGLYHGHPRTHRSVMDGTYLPDVISIFQEDVQAASRNPAELIEQVRKTVLHEIGHHFGLNEKELDELGYG